MMIPPKLTHGDNLANLFEKFNRVIDYLHEIRLVAGNGIRLNRLSAGTTIESTATASGGTSSAPPPGHPFDARIINKGTGENPDYYVRIYDSTLPDSPYAGVVYVYEWEMSVPVTDLAVTSPDGFYVVLDITYDKDGELPFSIQFSLFPYGGGSDIGYLTVRYHIASGKIPNVSSYLSGDIYVDGRWA